YIIKGEFLNHLERIYSKGANGNQFIYYYNSKYSLNPINAFFERLDNHDIQNFIDLFTSMEKQKNMQLKSLNNFHIDFDFMKLEPNTNYNLKTDNTGNAG